VFYIFHEKSQQGPNLDTGTLHIYCRSRLDAISARNV